MKTYFIRHSSELDVDQDTLDRMWNEQYAGIHYPHDSSGILREQDCSSTSPQDYAGRGKSSLEILLTIAREGGYVYTTYRDIPGAKLGIVLPGSEVQLFRGAWGNKNDFEGREALLKVLKLESVMNLSATECLPLSTVQPRKGTICQWRMIKNRVQAILEGASADGVINLSPELQEVMCMEFMRTQAAEESGLPILQTTLAPIGRTMPDVDIYGLSGNGQPVVAQVTYHSLEAAVAEGKLDKLDPYAKDGTKTIMFCMCDTPIEFGGHQIYPLDEVFRQFCCNSAEGKSWLSAVS
ncbi:hypothetical protein LG302_00785 [Halomonas organivorans]